MRVKTQGTHLFIKYSYAQMKLPTETLMEEVQSVVSETDELVESLEEKHADGKNRDSCLERNRVGLSRRVIPIFSFQLL